MIIHMEVSEIQINEIINALDDIQVSLAGINSAMINISNFLAVAVALYAHLTMNDTAFIKNNDDFEFGYSESLGLHCKAYVSNGEEKICPLSEVLDEDIGRRFAFNKIQEGK